MIEPEWRVSPLLLGSLASWPEIPRQPHLPSSCDQCPASDFNDSTFPPVSFTHSRLPLPMGTISVGGTSVLIVPKLGQRIMHIRSLIRTSHELYFYHSPCCAVYLRICIWVSVYFHAPLDLPQPKLCIVRPSSAELSCGSSSELWANVRQPGCRHLQVLTAVVNFCGVLYLIFINLISAWIQTNRESVKICLVFDFSKLLHLIVNLDSRRPVASSIA